MRACTYCRCVEWGREKIVVYDNAKSDSYVCSDLYRVRRVGRVVIRSPEELAEFVLLDAIHSYPPCPELRAHTAYYNLAEALWVTPNYSRQVKRVYVWKARPMYVLLDRDYKRGRERWYLAGTNMRKSVFLALWEATR